MKTNFPKTHYKKSTSSGDKTASGNSISKPHKYSYLLSEKSQGLCRKVLPELTKTASGVTFDGYSDYTWDAENRLTSIEVRDALVPLGAPKYRIEFKYDYSGRRISTKTFGGSVGNWELANETKYIYDGWNVIAEFSGTGLISKSYLWGLDLSGSLQGAGGVGELLSIEQHLGDGASRHYVAYDGNGNVVGLADADTGEMSALYEYDAFGQVLQMEGEYAVKNDYRFSTKPQEGMTGLYYYIGRFYNPTEGRWLNRDPIGSSGGFNLYGFNGQDAVNEWDYLGLENITAAGNRRIPVLPLFAESNDLEQQGDAIFGDGNYENVGSQRSRFGVIWTGGKLGDSDARNRGAEIAGIMGGSSDKTHNILAHSAGFQNALQGIEDYANLYCCKNKGKNITINLVAIAPKISGGLVRDQIERIKSLCPNLKLNVTIFYDSRDKYIPKKPEKGELPLWGNWETGKLNGLLGTGEEREVRQSGIDHHKARAAAGLDIPQGGTEADRARQEADIKARLNQ